MNVRGSKQQTEENKMRGLFSGIVALVVLYTVSVVVNKPTAKVSVVLEAIEIDGLVVEYK